MDLKVQTQFQFVYIKLRVAIIEVGTEEWYEITTEIEIQMKSKF